MTAAIYYGSGWTVAFAVAVLVVLLAPWGRWRRALAWLAWRARRPTLNGLDLPEFHRQLAIWRERKPS